MAKKELPRAAGYGVTMFKPGNNERKSDALRVMSPSLACARAPVITSATGRFAAFPERFRCMCLFQAACASERSFSLMHDGRSIPISKRNSRSRISSPRKAGASSIYVTGEIIKPSSTYLSRISADASPNDGSRSSTSRMTQVSTTMLMDVLPLEAHSSNRRSYGFYGKWRRSPAWPSRLSGSACGRLLQRRNIDRCRNSREDLCPAPSAFVREWKQEWTLVRAQLLLSLKFSCLISYIMSDIMSSAEESG